MRQILAIAALLGLLAAGRFIAGPEQPGFDRAAAAGIADASLARDLPAMTGHHASWLRELIDILNEMIDILDGRTPIPPRDPDSPEPAELEPEEIEEINDAVDDADAEGVDVPEERVEATWDYHEVRGFLTTVIEQIEDFLDSE